MIIGDPRNFALDITPDPDSLKAHLPLASMRLAVDGGWMGPPDRWTESGSIGPVWGYLVDLRRLPPNPPSLLLDIEPKDVVEVFWDNAFRYHPEWSDEEVIRRAQLCIRYEFLPRAFEPLTCVVAAIVRIGEEGIISAADHPDGLPEQDRYKLFNHRGCRMSWAQIDDVLSRAIALIKSIRHGP